MCISSPFDNFTRCSAVSTNQKMSSIRHLWLLTLSGSPVFLPLLSLMLYVINRLAGNLQGHIFRRSLWYHLLPETELTHCCRTRRFSASDSARCAHCKKMLAPHLRTFRFFRGGLSVVSLAVHRSSAVSCNKQGKPSTRTDWLMSYRIHVSKVSIQT